MTPLGIWLMARLAVHHHYNRELAPKRQEPLFGLGLRSADHLEVARLSFEIGRAKDDGPFSIR